MAKQKWWVKALLLDAEAALLETEGLLLQTEA
jgi:hypothetical protein